ncbi:STAS-like domain-containing protein [Pseudomonas sp. SDO5532_S415]
MNIVTIDMKSFSRAPFGRYSDDGTGNGEAFRKKFLLQPFSDPTVDRVVVKLDSVTPGYEYGSSFLEEAFGGLVRVEKLNSEEVLRKLQVETKNTDYIMEIKSYILEADV